MTVLEDWRDYKAHAAKPVLHEKFHAVGLPKYGFCMLEVALEYDTLRSLLLTRSACV